MEDSPCCGVPHQTSHSSRFGCTVGQKVAPDPPPGRTLQSAATRGNRMPQPRCRCRSQRWRWRRTRRGQHGGAGDPGRSAIVLTRGHLLPTASPPSHPLRPDQALRARRRPRPPRTLLWLYPPALPSRLPVLAPARYKRRHLDSVLIRCSTNPLPARTSTRAHANERHRTVPQRHSRREQESSSGQYIRPSKAGGGGHSRTGPS